MTSGLRSIVINPSERAVSSDINRAQSMSARGLAEAFRWMLDVNQGFDDTQAGGVEGQYNSRSAPMRGEVLGGLRVLVGIGNLQLGITAGLGMVIDPDSTPSTDDSPYKFVSDPGVVTTSGTLVMTPNSSGSPRIDVVECTRIQYPSPEIDSRDIFNPSTGFFTATSVTKTTESSFQYRVRAGTPGAGFPGGVDEWMILAVVLVPTGSTTNDTMTFWDVRPLVNDRVFGNGNTVQDLPRRTKQLWTAGLESGAMEMQGIIEATSGAGLGLGTTRRLGGQLRRGSPGVDYVRPYIDLNDSANVEVGFSPSSNFCYLYLLTPFNLPRWARYTDATSSPRVPRSPRGIPILSGATPSHAYGQPLASIEFPAVFGFTGTATTEGVCIAALPYYSGAVQTATCSASIVDANGNVGEATGSGGTADTGHFTLIEGQTFPGGVTRIRCLLFVNIQVSNVTTVGAIAPLLQTYNTNDPATQVALHNLDTQLIRGATGTPDLTLQWNFWLELATEYPESAGPQTYQMNYTLNHPTGQCTNLGAPTLAVVGWEYE